MKKLPILTMTLFLFSAGCWLVYGMGWHVHLREWDDLLLHIPAFHNSHHDENDQVKTTPVAISDSEIPESVVDVEVVSDSPSLGKGRYLLRKAQEELTHYGSLKAKIREVIRIKGKQYRAEGVYLQGNQMQLRMECTMKAGSSEGKMLQVCDGQLLWSQLQFGEIPEGTKRDKLSDYLRITRRNVDKILQEASQGSSDPRNFLTAELGFGGLPALLASIDMAMDFGDVKSDQIRSQNCLVIEGTWNETYQKQWTAIRSKVSSHFDSNVPNKVKLYFDAKSYFPVRIVYLKTTGTTELPMMAVEFFDVVRNAQIDPSQFVYIPPEGVPPKDVTHEYIKQLRELRD